MAQAARKITETAKKATTPAVETKAATAETPKAIKTPTARKVSAAKTSKSTTSTGKIHLMPPSFEQVANLAHKYWAERGHQHGFHEEDWYRAEQELRGKAS